MVDIEYSLTVLALQPHIYCVANAVLDNYTDQHCRNSTHLSLYVTGNHLCNSNY